jgi:hypothetical protein
VILAASAIESTRLALHSFPSLLMGRNLMAHVRSDFTVRIHRSALPPVPGHVQTAALLVRGAAPSSRFHIQVTASTSHAGSDELFFRMVRTSLEFRGFGVWLGGRRRDAVVHGWDA